MIRFFGFKGEWAYDHREGKGVATYVSGARYDGYWHNDKARILFSLSY